MSMQQQQQFCTNCGQVLTPGTAFCVNCGARAGAQQVSAPPSYAQAPTQGDDPLLAALTVGTLARGTGRGPRLARRRRYGMRGCGILLLVLVLLIVPFVGLAKTTGPLHIVFGVMAGALVVLFALLILLGMLASRRGREVLTEGCAEGCLEALLGGLFGG